MGMNCRILRGPPGSGKSLEIQRDLVLSKGFYLLALPRTELIDEFAADLRALAKQTGQAPLIIPIHSDQKDERDSVVRRLTDALSDHDEAEHVILIVTHVALLGLDPARLDDIHVRIDEVPECAILSGTFSAFTAAQGLDVQYDLEPFGDHPCWSRVRMRPKVEPLNPSTYNAEAKDLADFHKAASNSHRTVMVDLSDWADARTPRRRVRWWSVWTPMVLKRAASVSIAAAGFDRSLLFLACQKLHSTDLTFRCVDPLPAVPRAQPTIKLHYFTAHRGSTEWWRTDDGSRCLVQISQYLEKIGFNGYWASNEAIRPYFIHRFGGTACAPRMAGTNSLRHHTMCAYIYSNKAQNNDGPVLDALGLERDVITQARENEDIVQFVFRGKIRDMAFDGTYAIYLYSLDQTEALKTYLFDHNITHNVDLVAVDEADIMDVVRPDQLNTGEAMIVKPARMSSAERRIKKLENDRCRKRNSRAREREQRKADGTYRAPGPPIGTKRKNRTRAHSDST